MGGWGGGGLGVLSMSANETGMFKEAAHLWVLLSAKAVKKS